MVKQNKFSVKEKTKQFKNINEDKIKRKQKQKSNRDKRKNKINLQKENKSNNSNDNNENFNDQHIEQNDFFNFDGTTSIIMKLSEGRNKNKKINNHNTWNYNSVIKAENEVRQLKEAQKKVEQNENQMLIDKEEPNLQKNPQTVDNDEYDITETNINKFDNDVFSKNTSFTDFTLSKLILKGLANLEYFHPTKVQEKVIPIISKGNDVLVNAETGSGKTACYLLPIIQKIITNKTSNTPIKALILLPTRELAFQCTEMLSSFLKYLEEIKFVSICGGMSIENQINMLKNNPDILIATPGRLIDMLYNYKSVNCLENINILVLDEADKLLELGFKDGIDELISMIKDNSNRQTLLFSATLNPKIVDLGKDTLKNPIKVKMVKSAILTNLRQSIIRMKFKVKDESEENIFEQRMAYLIHFIQSANKQRSIVFFNTKKDCHKAFLILKSNLINSLELHSDISQPERLKALNAFQNGATPFLLCTDVAARGIDVEKVRCVINFQMPLMDERYIHRIGRTARKGYLGEAVTICDEKDRLNLKKLLKKEKFNVTNIKIDNSSIKKIYLDILTNKNDINHQFENYLIDKELMIAEKDVEKTINMKLHSNEIYNKPKKTWFMNKYEKLDLKKKIKNELNNENK